MDELDKLIDDWYEGQELIGNDENDYELEGV